MCGDPGAMNARDEIASASIVLGRMCGDPGAMTAAAQGFCAFWLAVARKMYANMHLETL